MQKRNIPHCLPRMHANSLFSYLFKRGVSAYLLLGFLVFFSNQAISQRYELVWSDEFSGNSLDLTKWSYQYGTGNSEGLYLWGNNELQYYTDLFRNLVVYDGLLTITAQKESYQGSQYTSARIRSQYKGDWTYGSIKVRAKIPSGKGLWPAVWMLPTDNFYGGWPKSGEIDIIEAKGNEPNKIYGTIHYGNNAPNNSFNGGSYTKPSGSFADDFHEFEVRWLPGSIQFFVDGISYYTTSTWFSPNYPFPAPFDKRFHLLINLAVGGHFGDNPDATTPFPSKFEIDYVRVFKDLNQKPAITSGIQTQPVRHTEGTKLELPVTITDTDGTVAEVKWYVNGQYIMSETTRPDNVYTLVWDVAMAGCSDVDVVFKDNDYGKDSVRVATIQTLETCGQQTPYSGSAITLPAVIPAANFDKGGQNVAYFETTPASNSGGLSAFRFQEAVDTKPFDGSKTIVTDAAVGEWLEYTVNVPQTGEYTISVSINRTSSLTNISMFQNETNIVTFARFPANTNGISTRTLSRIVLQQGTSTLRVRVDFAATELLEFSFQQATSNSEESVIPNEFSVMAFPNPFNPQTVLSVNISQQSLLDVDVFSLTGQKMQSVFRGSVPQGSHRFTVNATDWPSGVYLYRVQSNTSVKTGKLVLVK